MESSTLADNYDNTEGIWKEMSEEERHNSLCSLVMPMKGYATFNRKAEEPWSPRHQQQPNTLHVWWLHCSDVGLPGFIFSKYGLLCNRALLEWPPAHGGCTFNCAAFCHPWRTACGTWLRLSSLSKNFLFRGTCCLAFIYSCLCTCFFKWQRTICCN